MNVREVIVDGKKYRGPGSCNSAETPWRITWWARSTRRGTGGQPVGWSWQTYQKYESLTACETAMRNLERRAQG